MSALEKRSSRVRQNHKIFTGPFNNSDPSIVRRSRVRESIARIPPYNSLRGSAERGDKKRESGRGGSRRAGRLTKPRRRWGPDHRVGFGAPRRQSQKLFLWCVMAGILLRTSLCSPLASRYTLSLKVQEERNAGSDHSSSDPAVSGFLRWKTRAVSLLADSRGICPFWPLISDPLVPFFLSSPIIRVLLPLTLTISFSTDLIEPLGESLLRFSLPLPSSLPIVHSSESSRKKRMRRSNSATRIIPTMLEYSLCSPYLRINLFKELFKEYFPQFSRNNERVSEFKSFK